MAYNFLDLVNEVNRRLNEVELTADNFGAAVGFYAHNKDAVNSAIRDINHTHHEWPFNHTLAQEILTAGTTRYSFPSDANTIDFSTFRIPENTTLGNSTQNLNVVTYDEYVQKNIDQEYSSDTSKLGVPAYIFHAPSSEFGVVPAPDKNYAIEYEYYRIPVDLSLYSDVPNIPERFRHIIVDGAMYHAYMFRGNEQAASFAKNKYEEGLKKMRIMLVNRFEYVRATAIYKNNTRSGFGNRVL